jgi:hypothetical protein
VADTGDAHSAIHKNPSVQLLRAVSVRREVAYQVVCLILVFVAGLLLIFRRPLFDAALILVALFGAHVERRASRTVYFAHLEDLPTGVESESSLLTLLRNGVHLSPLVALDVLGLITKPAAVAGAGLALGFLVAKLGAIASFMRREHRGGFTVMQVGAFRVLAREPKTIHYYRVPSRGG